MQLCSLFIQLLFADGHKIRIGLNIIVISEFNNLRNLMSNFILAHALVVISEHPLTYGLLELTNANHRTILILLFVNEKNDDLRIVLLLKVGREVRQAVQSLGYLFYVLCLDLTL